MDKYDTLRGAWCRFTATTLLLCALLSAGCGSRTTIQSAKGNLTVDKLSLDFAAQRPGVSSKLIVTLANQGDRSIAIHGSRIDGDVRSAFHASALPDAIGAGASVQIEVRYSATAEGTDGASLVIDSDADNTPEAHISRGGRTLNACATGNLDCAGTCVDPLHDSQNCGGCGRTCDAAQICANGTCACKPHTCPAGACGQIGDGCGGTISCGGCGAPAECIVNVCTQPTCSDQRKNGDESDVDCGGATCLKCGAGKTCGPTDCLSTLDCVSGTCGLPTPTSLI